jgi:glutamate synthase (NADPH/NADH) small chain
MDSARTALRLGSKVTIAYRRSEKELPARLEEVQHAKEEGIDFKFLAEPVQLLGNEKGWVTGMMCVQMKLGEPDKSGRRSPIPIENSEFKIDTDAVIVAFGTRTNSIVASTTPGLATDSKGRIIADENGATKREGIFAGGDIVTGAATVILAMGEGRRAAKSIAI